MGARRTLEDETPTHKTETNTRDRRHASGGWLSRLTELTQANAQSLALTFRSLSISEHSTCSRSWLAAVLITVAGIPAWAP